MNRLHKTGLSQIGVGVGVGIGVEFDTDSDTDTDPDKTLSHVFSIRPPAGGPTEH